MPEHPPPATVAIHYVKSNFFRVVHVDGAIGGLTPNREIFVSLYNQRGPLPDMTQQAIQPDGTLGEEVFLLGSQGIMREMEVGLILDSLAARDLAKFLMQRVAMLEASAQAGKQQEK